jgi:hypothetical protein
MTLRENQAVKDNIMIKLNNAHARQNAEAEMKLEIAFWIGENIDNGIHANPTVIYRILFNERKALFEEVGRVRAFQLCREAHASEDGEGSVKYTDLFNTFNRKYFGGSLPEYKVRIVADVFFWIQSHDDVFLNLIDLGAEHLNLSDPDQPYYYSADGLVPSRIDLRGRQIILSSHQDGEVYRETQLIHHMARAATGTVSDREVIWQQEMERLRSLGAPVGDKYLEFGIRTGEYVA